MAYIGVSPSNGVRRKHTYTATAAQTSFSGAGAEGITLGYLDSNYVDVYQNGVKLSEADYTSTSGTAIVLATGATVSDMIEVVVYDVFSVADTVSKSAGGTFDGNVTMAGTLNSTGVVTANAGVVVDNITIDGTTIALSSGDLTLDVGGDIILDADGQQIYLKNGGTHWGTLLTNGTPQHFYIDSIISDGDLIFRGNDGGSTITALTLDMSDAGSATFNHNVKLPDNGVLALGAGSDLSLSSDGTNGTIANLTSDGDIIFSGNDGGSTIEMARFDCSNSGVLVIGKTGDTFGTAGHVFRLSGIANHTVSGNSGINVNRLSSDGSCIAIHKDSTTVGTIGTNGGGLYIGSLEGSDAYLAFASNTIYPATNVGAARDDAIDLGSASARFDDIYATNNAIQTSDRNEKQDIAELSDAEARVAVVAKGLMRKFRWKSAVAEKGDDARTHFGIIAQDLQDAFTAESLDASDYAMFCSDTWWEKEISVDAIQADEANDIEAQDAYTYMDTKQETTTGYTKKTRLGVRYSELLAFIISAI